MRKALGDLGMSATGIDVWLRATERISRASRQAGDRWSFYLVSATHQILRQPGDLQTELLRLPVEYLIRLVRTLSSWALTMEQAERALALWAEMQRLEREANHVLPQAA